MSTIYRDKKTGLYFLNIRIDGKRKRISLGTKNRLTAKLRARIKERDLTGIQDSGPISLSDFAQQYLTWAKSIRPVTTFKGEKNALERFLEHFQGLRVDQISAHHADDFVAMLASRPVSPASVNRYIRTLASIFSTAVKWGYATSNPFHSVKKMRVLPKPPRVISTAQLKAILKTTREHAPAYVDLWNFYLFTGFRRAEAIRMDQADIDFTDGFIYARDAKGHKVRKIPMLGPVRSILSARNHRPKPFEFTLDQVSRTFEKMAALAGVKATLHDLRRCFASYCTEIGIPSAWVQKWMGHVSWKTTEDYYMGISDEMYGKLKRFETMISEN